jgi:hypothetical protein
MRAHVKATTLRRLLKLEARLDSRTHNTMTSGNGVQTGLEQACGHAGTQETTRAIERDRLSLFLLHSDR